VTHLPTLALGDALDEVVELFADAAGEHLVCGEQQVRHGCGGNLRAVARRRWCD